MRDIGKNIRDLRERAKLTQDALAEQLCTTRQTISNYERGKTRPDVEQILRLAAIFGTDANAILYGPPGAERRRDARLRTVLSGMIWGVLQTGYWLLDPAAEEQHRVNAEGASVAFASSRNASCVRLFLMQLISLVTALYPLIGAALRLLNVPAQQNPVCKDV